MKDKLRISEVKPTRFTEEMPRTFTREKAKEMAKHVKFCHFNVKNSSSGTGAATVAITDDGERVYYGVSLCSPLDNFNRREGRGRALRRLFEGTTLSGSRPAKGEEKLAERFQGALLDCLEDEQKYFSLLFNQTGNNEKIPWYVPLMDDGRPSGGPSDISFRKPRKEKQ